MLDVTHPPCAMISDKVKHARPGDIDAAMRGAAATGESAAEIIEAYEEAIAAWFGNRHALAVSSGGGAISVALAALGITAGDEIIVSPTCPLCTVYPILELGAVPVFCDTQAESFGLCLEDLESVVTSKTRAVIEVPMWGYPTDLEGLERQCRTRNLPLILDLAHCHGSLLRGKPLSAFGDVACYSTHDRKPLSTGEGGFLLSNQTHLMERCRRYTRFGDLDGVHVGLNFKLSPVQAALGLHRLKSLSAQISRRRENAEVIKAALANSAFAELPLPVGSAPNYYAFLLRLPLSSARDVIDALELLGIPSDVKRYGCRPLYEFPVLRPFARTCPKAEVLIASVTTLPVHPDLTDQELDRLASAVQTVRPH
jgi:dTDP-4-amino-4,6-dideoxygalactose transaminase